MNILINFATLKKGGGQTVALNFIKGLSCLSGDENHYYYVVARGSCLEKAVRESGFPVLFRVSHNPLLRLLQEFFTGRALVRKAGIDCIYSYFGTGFYQRKVPQVSGSADSNLFYPELDFWQEYSGLKKLKRKIVDFYRIWGLKRAHGVVFENEELLDRFRSMFPEAGKSIYIAPSINSISLESARNVESDDDTICCLFLCGWQLNKNVMMIPELAKRAGERGVKLNITLTAPLDDSYEMRSFQSKVREYGVEDKVSLIGAIPKEDLKKLYSSVDFVMLLSKLESFSNNIIEAWAYGRVLVVSDLSWARSICKSAACYVDRNSADDIIDTLANVKEDPSLYASYVSEGRNMLRSFPSLSERTRQEIFFLSEVCS